jgi:peptidoglycan/LPS O-acetylase OafA/YrhL
MRMDNGSRQGHELYEYSSTPFSTLPGDLERHQQDPGHVIADAPLRTRTRTRPTAFLDGLRGLGALLVFIQHSIGSYDANVHEHGFGEDGNYYLGSLPFLRIFFSGGHAAVAIFFVLSGYVLTKSPLGLVRNGKVHACGASLLSAVIRRPIRLYLPPLGVAFVYAMLMHAPFHIVPEVPWPQPKETVFAEVANWLTESATFFNPFQVHGSANQAWYSYNLVAWTIPIELKGSMLVYALTAVYAFSHLPPVPSLLLLAITSIVLLQLGEWTMACFIAGLILACMDVCSLDTTYLGRRLTHHAQSILWNVIFFVGYYLLCQPAHAGSPEYSLNTPGWYYFTLLAPKPYDKDQYYRYWHSWGALLVVYSSLRIRWLQQFLETRTLRYLGKVSFMLYLVHLPMFYILSYRVGRMLGQVWEDTEDSWWNNRLRIPDVGPAGMSSRYLVSLGIMLSVCLPISEFGTRVLDMPSVRAGKIIVKRLGLDKGISSRMEIENAGARHSEHSIHPPEPSQQ